MAFLFISICEHERFVEIMSHKKFRLKFSSEEDLSYRNTTDRILHPMVANLEL